MKINLPNSAFLGNLDPLILNLDTSNPGVLEITANQKWLSLHPVVLAMAASLGLKVKPENIHFAPFEAKSAAYLERMGLFKYFGQTSGISITSHEPAGRFIPLTQIRDSIKLTQVITDLVPLLHLEPTQAEPIRYIISELVRNVLEHARSPQGAIMCAQYYAKSNTVRIGIADNGVGIKTSINQAHEANTDLEAIHLALTPGITGTTKLEGGTAENAGAGLFFTKSIAMVNRDFLVIYSGRAMYKLLKRSATKRLALKADPFADRHSADNHFPHWQGTVIGVDLSLEANPKFTHLLDLIRTTYVKAIRERQAKSLKQPRFI